MNEPKCFCLSWTYTVRQQRNGVTVVAKQCSVCGRALGNVKKDQHDLSRLQPFDESKAKAWGEKWDAWRKEQQRLFELKQNEWFIGYNKYLNSEHWKKLRQVVLRRDQICQRCFHNQATQAHHVSYEGYKKFGFSFAVECAGLCSPCHDLIHGRDAL